MQHINRLDLNQILFSLSALNRTQLEQVRKHTAFLLQHKTGSVAVEDEDWLLVGILSELKRIGLESRDTFRLKKPSSFASFQTQSEYVRGILLGGASPLSSVDRRALGSIVARALADYIRSWPHEVNREAMMNNVARVPEAVEWAFPGYLGAGVLEAVIR